MYSLNDSEVAVVEQSPNALETLPPDELELRGQLGSDPVSAHEKIVRRAIRDNSLDMISVGGIVMSPLVGMVAALPLSFNPFLGLLAGFGASVVTAVASRPPLVRRMDRTSELSGAWARWVIEDLKSRSGVELNADDLEGLDYPTSPVEGDQIVGSIDKFFPGEGVARITLVSENGQLKIFKGETVPSGTETEGQLREVSP